MVSPHGKHAEFYTLIKWLCMHIFFLLSKKYTECQKTSNCEICKKLLVNWTFHTKD